MSSALLRKVPACGNVSVGWLSGCPLICLALLTVVGCGGGESAPQSTQSSSETAEDEGSMDSASMDTGSMDTGADDSMMMADSGGSGMDSDAMLDGGLPTGEGYGDELSDGGDYEAMSEGGDSPYAGEGAEASFSESYGDAPGTGEGGASLEAMSEDGVGPGGESAAAFAGGSPGAGLSPGSEAGLSPGSEAGLSPGSEGGFGPGGPGPGYGEGAGPEGGEGSGYPGGGEGGGSRQPQAPPAGTAEHPAFHVVLGLMNGKTEGLAAHIGKRATGTLASARLGKLTAKQTAELKQAFAQPQLIGVKSVSGGKQINLRSGTQIIQLTVKKEGKDFKVTDMKIRKSSRR